jgi:hypothetical protein
MISALSVRNTLSKWEVEILMSTSYSFFHRGLYCLGPIGLKVGRFDPEHLRTLNSYLEALDEDIRKPLENPPIGLLLCVSKDKEVVEYALRRNPYR